RPLLEAVAKTLTAWAIQSDVKPGGDDDRLSQDMDRLADRLAEEYPEQLWAINCRALVLWLYFENAERAYDALLGFPDATGPDEERHRSTLLLHNCAGSLGRGDQARDVIRGALPPDDPFIVVLDAHELLTEGKRDQAKAAYTKALEADPQTDLAPEIHYRLSQIAAEEEDWPGAAEELFKARQDILRPGGHPEDLRRILGSLVSVRAMMQDAAGVLETADELARHGLEDAGSLWMKAQALRNLQRLEEACGALDSLLEKEPGNSEYARMYSDVLLRLGQTADAIEALRRFTQDNDLFDPQALGLRVNLLLAEHGLEEQAFSEMQQVQGRIQDDPQLLLLLYRAGHSAGKEAEVGDAFERVMALKQAGQVPDGLLTPFSLEDMTRLLIQRRKSREQLLGSYQQAGVPREVIAAFDNCPLYLDWAVRTQSIGSGVLLADMSNFVTYQSFGLRLPPNAREEAVPNVFRVPEEARAIMVDYDALITLDQLGLLPELTRRFDKVHYLQAYHA
ncbi:hypothetical protein LCGC14_2475560, partial [marine sediment metagenome]